VWLFQALWCSVQAVGWVHRVRDGQPPVQCAGATARVDTVDRDREAPLPLAVRGALGGAVEEIRLDRLRGPQIGDPRNRLAPLIPNQP
jgi:hypothetical protein